MTTTKTRNTASPCRSITSRDSLQFSLQAKSISRFAFLMIWRIVSAMECSSSTARTLSTCCQLLRLSPGNTFQVTFYDGIFKFPCVFQDQLCFYVSNSQFTHFAIFSIFFQLGFSTTCIKICRTGNMSRSETNSSGYCGSQPWSRNWETLPCQIGKKH